MAHGRNATTIGSKLIRQMLVVGLVPLLLLGGLTYFLMSNAIDLFGRGLESSAQAMEQRVVGAALTKAAEDVTARIDTYVEERVKDVAIWASDPLVIEAIEICGKFANGRNADLKIVEVPDEVKWTIEEYDGVEWIAEEHRTWS